jgi:hypothetical protein
MGLTKQTIPEVAYDNRTNEITPSPLDAQDVSWKVLDRRTSFGP